MLADLTRYELTLESRLEEIVKVEQLIDRLKDEVGFSDEIYGNMIVSVTEAVNNAIGHGNRLDPSKRVILSLAHENQHLIFIIKDQGPGFDYNNIPDPTAPENLEKPTGRGVFLMKNLSDMVVFSDNGCTVEIHFRV